MFLARDIQEYKADVNYRLGYRCDIEITLRRNGKLCTCRIASNQMIRLARTLARSLARCVDQKVTVSKFGGAENASRIHRKVTFSKFGGAEHI